MTGPSTSVTRRRFVALGLGGAAVVSLGGLAVGACGTTGDEQAAGGDLTLEDLDGLEAIGVAYVRATPDEASPEVLAEALGLTPPSGDGNDGDGDTSVDAPALLEQRATTIRGDFTSGEVVELDGWVLSRTEARIAGLAAYGSGALDG